MKRKSFLIVFLSFVAVLALSFGLAACSTSPENEGPEDTGYKLTYAKGAYGATGEAPEKRYEEGEEVTLADASTFVLEGYTIDKWSDGENEYEPSSTFTMPAHDVKLTAKWIQGDPNAPVVTAESVGFEDGYFVFTGTVENVNSLYVYMNNTNVSDSNSNYVEAVISGSAFRARLPLSTLIGYNKTNTPFNLRYRIDSTTSAILGVAQGSLDLSATCHYGEYNFRLAVNSGTNCVAVYYDAAPDTSVVVTATSVAFDDGEFVVGGIVQNVEHLYIYLINTYHEATLDNYVEANIDGNTFTARLSLATLAEKGGETNDPFNLRYRVNESTLIVNIPQGTLDISQTHSYGGNDFRLGVNGSCVAVYYKPTPEPVQPDYSISISAMYFDVDKFVVEGTCGESVESLILHLHNTNSPVVNVPFTAVISEGNFRAEVMLSQIKNENGDDPAAGAYINVRYERNDEGLSSNNNFVPGDNGNADYAVDVSCEYEGKIWTLKADTNRTYLTWAAAPVTPEPGEPDYSISVSNMCFSDGKFIVEGVCGADVDSIVFHLHNTNSPVFNVIFAAVIKDGEFKAEIALDQIKYENGNNAPATYINVRYEWNDEGFSSSNNLLPGTNGDFTVGQEYRYGDRTWTLKADSSRTYLNWSAVTDSYRITELKLELVNGIPTLTIAGTTADATIEANQIRLLLDKTTGNTEKKYIDNTQTEAGKFSFTIELTDLIASIDTPTASQQQAYFIRLYNGGTKIADINSRWASDLLWERGQIETDDAVYFLMKNTEWSNSSWNTLGIVKVEKNQAD